MADHFNIEVNNAEVVQFLQRLTSQLDDMSPVYAEIGTKLEQNIELRFNTKTDPNSNQWAEHKSSTKALYKKQDTKVVNGKSTVVSRGSLLERTGAMRKSLNHLVDSDGVVIGFNSRYAQYHEYGTKKMVRRGMMLGDPIAGELGQDDALDVMVILGRYIDDALQN